MSAMGQIHTHDSIAGLAYRKLYSHICLCAGVGLHIGILTAKELLCSLDGQVLHHIHTLASAVVSLSRIAFCVLVGQRAAHSCHNSLGNPVFRCDQLDVAVLTGLLIHNGLGDLRIHILYFVQ